jgi:hypothetical protein
VGDDLLRLKPRSLGGDDARGTLRFGSGRCSNLSRCAQLSMRLCQSSHKQRGKNFAVFIVGADLCVCPGDCAHAESGADTQVCPYAI